MSKFSNTSTGFFFDTSKRHQSVEVDVWKTGTVSFTVSEGGFDSNVDDVWFDVEDWDEFVKKVNEARKKAGA